MKVVDILLFFMSTVQLRLEMYFSWRIFFQHLFSFIVKFLIKHITPFFNIHFFLSMFLDNIFIIQFVHFFVNLRDTQMVQYFIILTHLMFLLLLKCIFSNLIPIVNCARNAVHNHNRQSSHNNANYKHISPNLVKLQWKIV